ncbi:MAG: histidine phosphatase family protein [Candidatus Pacebacteria bacterium]|nr:histidine phosphatase family protein [Candidatus Paceibacterota bacterium]MBP9840578.1 histidine phosphatase family protein [Candidatus Paceibacterota bacterium]
MKYLIIVRHGDYDTATLGLSASGTEKIEMLTRELCLRELGRLRILTSTAKRAVESAGILSLVSNSEPEQYALLRSDAAQDPDMPAALKLVKDRGADVDTLLIVTHQEYCDEFPSYFGKNELQTRFQVGSIDKGQAVIIDCATKTFERV